MATAHATSDTEVWKPVVGFEGLYEVSNLGTVRSTGRGKAWQTSRLMKPSIDRRGYANVALSNGVTRRTTRAVHRIVLEAFAGCRPSGMECRHLNGDKRDNRLRNLQWGTPKENAADRRKHGQQPEKLTASQVEEIRARADAWRAAGRSFYRMLAREYGVSSSHIGHVARREKRA
jgi:hypothetical protein